MNKSIIMSIMMLAGSFALANNGNGDNNVDPKKTNTETQPQTSEEEEKNDDAIHCVVEVKDKGKVTCWFCDCKELAKSLLLDDDDGSEKKVEEPTETN